MADQIAPPHQPVFPEARIAGHAIGLIVGVALLFGGVLSISKDMPPVLSSTMLILGALMVGLTVLSYQYSRMAWSFMFSIEVVLALVTLFGSPKVRNLIHIPLGAAMVIPIVLAIGAIALYLSGEDYRGTVSQKSQNAAR